MPKRSATASFVLGLLAALPLLAVWHVSDAAAYRMQGYSGKPLRAVVELFTSQACPECPAADAVLQSYADRDDVIALSLPVDIWDYKGWKDTLASERNTERLEGYVKTLKGGRRYTPQVVINGRSHVLGSDKRSIDDAIEEQNAKGPFVSVSVRLGALGRRYVVHLEPEGRDAESDEATIWMAVLQREAKVKVERGENAGRTLIYRNVVRELTPIGLWSGGRKTIHIARHAFMRLDTGACVVIVQKNGTGPIIGAAWLGL